MKLIAIALCCSSVCGAADKSCRSGVNGTPSTQSVEKVFATLHEAENIYQPRECLRNVIRAFRFLKSAIPELEAFHFNVLIIMDPTQIERTRRRSPIARFITPDPAESIFAVIPNRSDSPIMNFHVVLEFKGRIFDLDDNREESRNGMNEKEYFSTFFIRENLIERVVKNTLSKGSTVEELVVYTIPGWVYLGLPVEKNWGLSYIAPFLRRAPAKLVTQYY
jgi:hypothetical protein